MNCNAFNSSKSLSMLMSRQASSEGLMPGLVSPCGSELGEPLSAGSHRVYNFEVACTHTYIADGIRVHNTSALAFLSDDEIPIGVILSEDGTRIEAYLAELKGDRGVSVSTRMSVDENGDTDSVEKTFLITREGHDEVELVVANVYEKDENGEPDPDKLITSQLVSANLFGSQVGAETLKSLTPFLATALMGNDASLLESVAANTVLDVALEKALLHKTR